MICICKNLTGKIISLLFAFIFLLVSCNPSKNIKIEKKEKQEVLNYYQNNKIKNDILFLKNFENYKKLDSLNFTTIPDIFIFDQNGKLIKIDEDEKKECINDPILFLENIEYRKVSFIDLIDLQNYVNLFELNSELDTEFNENNNQKFYIFINTATFTDRLNQIRFNDSKKIEKNNKKIIFVNLDLLKEWFN